MTLKNNRAPLLSHIKIWAQIHRHMWIQTGVTVQKLLNWVLTFVILTSDLDITWWSVLKISWRYYGGNTLKKVWQTDWSVLKSCFVAAKNREPLLCHCKLCASFCSRLETQNCALISVTTICMNITFVNVNNSWKFHDIMTRNIVKKLWQMDGQTDVFLKNYK